MRLSGKDRKAAFAGTHAECRSALDRWVEIVEAADWKSPADMKKTFGSADIVGNQTVFNVGGNKCRLIALVHYKLRSVLIQHVLTHSEYDKEDWKA